MTKQEVNKLLALLRVNYSYAFKGMSEQDKYMLVNVWTFALQDIDADIVMLAVMQIISTSKWIPTVAEVREKCRSIRADAESGTTPDWMVRQGLCSKNQTVYRAIMDKTKGIAHGDCTAEIPLDAMLNNPGVKAMLLGRTEYGLLDTMESKAWSHEGLDEVTGKRLMQG